MANEMVPANEDTRIVPATAQTPGNLLTEWEGAAAAIATSLAIDKPESIGDVIKCMGKPDRYAKNVIGEEIIVRDWFLHPVEVADERTGELEKILRLVFVCQDGKTVGCTGQAVISKWRHILRVFGGMPKFPPLGITLQQFKGRSGHDYHDIVSVRVIQAEKTGRGK